MAYLRINDNNLVTGYSPVNDINFPIEYDFTTSSVSLEDLKNNPNCYYLINGNLVYDDTLLKEKEFKQLVIKRQNLFKQYVDRSPMWYQKLTSEQDYELDMWYQAWCDMPIAWENGTWVEPSLPTWLK